MLILIIGFLLLVLGADFLVKGSSNIAKKFHIPEILIGLTIVAIGTSMPELMVTISSANHNSTDLILGNVIGSNLCNLLLILGLTAFLKPVEIDKETKKIHLPIAFFSTIIILFFGILGKTNNTITEIEGTILVFLYFLYFLYPITIELKDILDTSDENKKKHIKTGNILPSILLIGIGVIGLKIGGDLVVDKATEIATLYGISERVIGSTIVAIGTALPELITSIVAVIKKEDDLAIGNLIGSCILNAFLILGLGAMIKPLYFSPAFIDNLIILAGSIILIWIYCFIGNKNTITRFESTTLLGIYAFYMMTLFK